MAQQQDEAARFLMGGGGGPKSLFDKYDKPGTLKGGEILSWEYTQQIDLKTRKPKVWDNNGEPMMQLVVTIQTNLRNPEIEDDDGRRRAFLKGEMAKATREAVIEAGADMIEKHGHIAWTYVGDGPSAGPGLDGPKLYSATYRRPALDAAVTHSATPASVAVTSAPTHLRAAETATPHAVEAAAVAELQRAGLVAAQQQPAAPAGLAAALAALSPAERAALGLPT